MAFAARLGPLAEELVDSLFAELGKKQDATKVKRARETILHKLKSHTSLRTNQFEVEDTLNGLEERLRVNNRDSLADALRQRLDALLQLPSKWHPDILHLLLELSDQPVYKSRLSDLESLRPKTPPPETPLRWEEIAIEDDWARDPGLWSTIQYSDSSDEEVYTEETSGVSVVTSETHEAEAAQDIIDRLVIAPSGSALLDSVRKGQDWRAGASSTVASNLQHKAAVPEFQVIREVLFMLQGLRTSIFNTDGTANARFQTAHLTWDAHKAVISSFVEPGRQLNALRRFAEHTRTEAHLQAFQDCVHKHLESFELQANVIESRLAQAESQTIVSLNSVKGDLDTCLEPLAALAKVVTNLEGDTQTKPFQYLELLFEEVTLAQLVGQSSTFETLVKIFLDCFNVFLRPIRHWMDEGRLIPGDTIFFVTESAENLPLRQIWQDRYFVRKDSDGNLHAPHFLRPAAKKIFTAGKNIVVLRHLGKHAALREQSRDAEPALTYEAVCPSEFSMAPFPDLFEAAFERWIQSKYRKTSQLLTRVLFESCHLSHALNALQRVYFMSDGSAATYFCNHLFATMDASRGDWHDRYALTVLGQEAFGEVLDAGRLSVSVDRGNQRRPASTSTTTLESVRSDLPSISVLYRLSWPIHTVLTPGSLSHYQTVFTFSLQIRKALFVLRSLDIVDRSGASHRDGQEEALFYGLRNSLLWFCTNIQAYLTTLVLAPDLESMQLELQEAEDVDAMILIHDSTLKRIIDESLLGNRLTKICECILDVLDLCIKLGHARQATGLAERSKGGSAEDDDQSLDAGHPTQRQTDSAQSPESLLSGIKLDFDRHLRFICDGLRSVARASSDSPSTKWDMLADMLQPGIRHDKW
ncbi:Gamma-tubulin complex component 5 [Paramyrothecium foliicola]|nr:Gamma-tubulin complex component 5 [Paramyrothecium foliicola]